MDFMKSDNIDPPQLVCMVTDGAPSLWATVRGSQIFQNKTKAFLPSLTATAQFTLDVYPAV